MNKFIPIPKTQDTYERIQKISNLLVRYDFTQEQIRKVRNKPSIGRDIDWNKIILSAQSVEYILVEGKEGTFLGSSAIAEEK